MASAGKTEIHHSSGRNRVPLETYLAAVICSEMSPIIKMIRELENNRADMLVKRLAIMNV